MEGIPSRGGPPCCYSGSAFLLFVAGLLKTWTYGAILIFHGVSTLSAFAKYLQPFDNLLFFAAWPMLAACAALFLLRDYDTLTLSRQPVPTTA